MRLNINKFILARAKMELSQNGTVKVIQILRTSFLDPSLLDPLKNKLSKHFKLSDLL